MLPTKFQITLLAAALTGLMTVQAVAAERAAKRPAFDQVQFNVCKGMQQAEREKDGACIAVMKRAKISMVDVERMHDCETRQPSNTMSTEDPDCKAMIVKYPEFVRGHGESMAPPEQVVK